MNESRIPDEAVPEEHGIMGLPVGGIIAAALLAGVAAFLLRRALQSDEDAPDGAADFGRAESDLRQRAAMATGGFLRSHVAPELKPMLISVLKEVRDYADQGFLKAERAIEEF